MKRRAFLTSAAALSLFVTEVFAAKKTSTASSSKKAKAATSKKKTTTRNKKPAVSAAPASQVRSADMPVTERPPEGTSASRLPPVKPPELPNEWRTYEVVTRLAIPASDQPRRLWTPLPFSQDTLYQRTLGHRWEGNSQRAGMHRLPDAELEVFQAEWVAGMAAELTLTTYITTADRHFDVTKRTVAPEREDILRRNLQSSQLIPNDGLAHQLGQRIVGRVKDPVAQAKEVYDWVTETAIYDPSLPGCGTGDVHHQLITGQYGGKSADINGLFVAICRAIGIPARCVYGLRVGPSRLFRSLGLSSDDATSAQHVRAEFYIPGYGWIPVDPSDVRRAIGREGLSDQDSRLNALKRVLFGVWEMNWIAFNVGSDISLPEQNKRQPFFLFPQFDGQPTISNGTPPYRITARPVLG
ncbi:MAG: transglutaminase-like domain-containing protein [Dechloromonas sp.]|nr:transglutaminase-like domain-containing protein [Dechloromonas sp.]